MYNTHSVLKLLELYCFILLCCSLCDRDHRMKYYSKQIQRVGFRVAKCLALPQRIFTRHYDVTRPHV